MQFLDDDIVTLRRADGTTRQYFWGDRCEVLAQTPSHLQVRIHGAKEVVDEGLIHKSAKLRTTGVLRLSMVDVQQGDGLILETPQGRVIFIDGGDNQLFARHAAARFSGTTAQDPLVVDAMVITHGDADHFAGLTELRKSETDSRPAKRIFVAPRRVYHNGLVKRPTGAAHMLGPTADIAGRRYCVGLVDSPADVPSAERNSHFKTWVTTLETWAPRVQAATQNAMEVRRLDHTTTDAFDFLADEGIAVELLGPITEPTPQGPGLAFLHDPPDDAGLMLGVDPAASPGAYSDSHTINGHSISFRLRLGNVRFLLTGDLNQESMHRLHAALPNAALRAEIMKTPHHGAADFDFAFLQEVGPVVSMISSGDESAVKEYIHPRATLMAALGKASRTTPAIIFCTELAAFFSKVGNVKDETGRTFYAFERTNFGIVHVRTDGERVLAFTHSGKEGMNEAYRFTVSPTGAIAFTPKVTKRSAPAAP
jgi:beta-lactamase superfamily II metal-dependent hydrolase